MSGILDSKSLIKSIKRRAFIPSSQETFKDVDFLEMATEEINIGLMTQIMEARGDYLVYYKDFSISSTHQYEIPSRAHGNKLRDVALIDRNGLVIREMSQISLEESSDVDRLISTRNNICYLMNNMLIVPNLEPSSDYKIRMWFYMRPNTLVTNDNGAVISSISSGAGDTTVLGFSTLPKKFTTQLQLDIVAKASPNKIISYDIVPVSIDLTLKTITINNSDLGSINIGDYVTEAGESIVPNLPTEYHPIIAQRVAVACLEAMGDEQNKQSAERKLALMERDALKIVTNRIEGAPKKLRNRRGTLNEAIKRKWR